MASGPSSASDDDAHKNDTAAADESLVKELVKLADEEQEEATAGIPVPSEGDSGEASDKKAARVDDVEVRSMMSAAEAEANQEAAKETIQTKDGYSSVVGGSKRSSISGGGGKW